MSTNPFQKALCFLVLFCLGRVCQGKFSSGSIQQHTEKHIDGWWYLDKFCFGLGANNIITTLTFKTEDLHKVKSSNAFLAFYIDDTWNNVVSSKSCKERREMNTTLLSLADDFTQSSVDGFTTLTYASVINQFVRPHYWYISYVNCHTEDNSYVHQLEDLLPDVHYTVTFTQAGGSHTSVEEQSMLIVHLMTLAAFTVVGWRYWSQLTKVRQQSYVMSYSLPPFVVLLSGAVLCQFFAVLLETTSWLWYTQKGTDFHTVKFFSEFCETLTHFLITFLFIGLSFGWLKVQSMVSMEFRLASCSDQENIKQLKFIGCGMFVLHTALLCLSRQQDTVNGASHSYHEYDTWVHKLLMVLRVSYFGCCAYGFNMNKIRSPVLRIRTLANGPGVTNTDADTFFLLITVWFLVTPVSLVVSELFAEYWRHAFITCLTLVVQSSVLAYIGLYSLGKTTSSSKRSSSKGFDNGGLQYSFSHATYSISSAPDVNSTTLYNSPLQHPQQQKRQPSPLVIPYESHNETVTRLYHDI